MRSKHSSRTRTRTHSREQRLSQGAWANRYDYLNTSPPPPPPPQSSSPTPSPSSSPTLGASSEQQAKALSLELFGANAKATEKRDWADDDVPSTLFSPGRFPLVLDVATGSTPGRKEVLKQPHDASVFVGSLPPHKDEAELAQLLAQHLSRHAKVQNIKIVRDSKGGLCAFVQCENARQAAQLVTQAQASQQSFLGRYLRYENAKARRTLWISYRTPLNFMACSSQDEEGPDIVTDDNGVRGRWIESDLPDALRIWKPRDARYPIVTLRGEARNIGDASRFDRDTLAPNVPAAFQQKGILFTDLKFDAQTVRRMAEAFGPLESFRALTTDDTGEDAYPLGHDATRTPGMDAGVWEIKWEHRDDCVTALNTLRRVHHLTVTWAKDTVHLQTPRTSFLRTPTSPRYPYPHPHREVISPIVRGRPFLLLDRNSGRENAYRNADLSSSSQTSAQSSKVASPRKGPVRLGLSLTRRGNETVHGAPEGKEIDDDWTLVSTHGSARTVLPVPTTSSERAQGASEGNKGKIREWSEGDFPPLSTNVRSAEIKKVEKDRIPDLSAIPLNDHAPASTKIEEAEASSHERHEEADPEEGDSSTSRPLVAHRRSLSNPVSRLQVEVPQTSAKAQGLEIPPTPELANSSLMQSPISGQPELETPAHPAMIPLPTTEHNVERKFQPEEESQSSEELPSESEQSSMTGGGIAARRDHRRNVNVDPRTVFVGGLESYGPRSWDESRLREIFGKYGEVREVHIVCPTKKAGFAFVSFTNEESATKAISAEHNRFYDGRQIRVQIRDIYPSRGGFKFRGRGFGRRPFGFNPHFDGMHRHPNAVRPNETGCPSTFNQNKSFGHQLVYASGPPERSPMQTNPHGAHGSYPLVPSTSFETDSSTLRSLHSFDSRVDPEAFQETDSKTAVSDTPPPAPSSLTASASGTIAPVVAGGLPTAPVSYYPPHAWTAPFGVQMHYPMPYGAYGGMVPHMPVPYAPTGQSSDVNPVNSSAQIQWNSMYRAGIPFAPYPYFIVPPAGTDTTRSAVPTTSQPTTPVKSQPPLNATGFIQGEHGVLFPVYPQEALSDYMSGCSPTQTAAAHASASTTGAVLVGQQQQQPNLPSAQMWHGYPHAPHFIAYPIPPASSVGVTSSTTPPSLVSQHAAQQPIASQPLQVPATHHPGPYATSSVSSAGHSIPVHHSIFTPRSSISSMHSMPPPPPYFVGAYPSSAGVSPAGHRSGFHSNQATHGTPPERSNAYMSRQPPRRDPAHQHGRNGQHTYGRGSDAPVVYAPSMTRSASGYSNSSRADYPHNNASFHQRQQSYSAAAPPLQLGINKHIQDGGPPHQQHQWTANMQQ